MPKLKTHKGVASRIKVTGRGKLRHFKAGRRHLLSVKRSKLTRKMRRSVATAHVDTAKLRRLLPYQ